MAGICSRHRRLELGCWVCATSIRRALLNFNQQLAEAKAVGEHICKVCGFTYFRAIGRCPVCWRDASPPSEA
jgi:rubrerythrin